MIGRRKFLARLARLGMGSAVAGSLWNLLAVSASAANVATHPARFWRSGPSYIHCELCPRAEVLEPGQTGQCHARRNVGGKMVTLAYDQPCIQNVDPIEKNPLAHVVPGAEVLAIAHAGCNLRCQYCQNWQFSQRSPDETRNLADFDRPRLIGKAAERKLRGLAFTYTEPTVAPEFLAETTALAASKGMLLTLCTCGYVQEAPFRELLKPFAAVTITLKGATEAFYEKVCGAKMAPVLDSMRRVKEAGKWLEVATLIVPTMNDETPSLEIMAKWIAANLGANTPWHLERFNPQYKLTNLPPTPQTTMEKARQIGQQAGLKFVYISNLAPHDGNHTYCPGCHKAVITRLGFKVLRNELKNGTCPHCKATLPGLWA